MPRRRYRHVPSAMIEPAATRGYLITKAAFNDLAADYHNECWRRRQPSVIVIQPWRYCEVEFSTSTMTADCLNGPIPSRRSQDVMKEIFAMALQRSKATNRTCTLARDSGTFHGLDLPDAKAFASWLFEKLSDPETYVLRPTLFAEPHDIPGGAA